MAYCNGLSLVHDTKDKSIKLTKSEKKREFEKSIRLFGLHGKMVQKKRNGVFSKSLVVTPNFSQLRLNSTHCHTHAHLHLHTQATLHATVTGAPTHAHEDIRTGTEKETNRC